MPHPIGDIELQIMWNRLIAVVEEQATTLVRTASSTWSIISFCPNSANGFSEPNRELRPPARMNPETFSATPRGFLEDRALDVDRRARERILADVAATECRQSLDQADREACQIEIAFGIQAGHFRRLAAHERAAREAAAVRDAADHGLDHGGVVGEGVALARGTAVAAGRCRSSHVGIVSSENLSGSSG